jgi:hypothetical protein
MPNKHFPKVLVFEIVHQKGAMRTFFKLVIDIFIEINIYYYITFYQGHKM